MFFAQNILDFEVKKANPCYLSDYQCTKNIYAGAIELKNKIVGVSFQDEVDSIQPMPNIFESLENLLTLFFCSVIDFLL